MPNDTENSPPALELLCIAEPERRPIIRPMPVDRDWMDATPERFAYRCLPLNIANAHGWEVLCPGPVEIVWNGDTAAKGLKVMCREPVREPYALSHFGSGIVTFPIHALIRTPPGYDLWVMGPPNRPKDGIYPLSGVVEADWSPYGFTMNWRMTRAGHLVRFEKGEPFAAFFLVPRGLQEQVTPHFAKPTPEAEVEKEHAIWGASRKEFLETLPYEDSHARKTKWQKGYFQGKLPSGGKADVDHRTQLRLKDFTEKED